VVATTAEAEEARMRYKVLRYSESSFATCSPLLSGNGFFDGDACALEFKNKWVK
jgi:hypothetical protein